MMKKSNLKIYGLIGYPVKHSLSPVMHNVAFKKSGIDAEYRLFEVKPEELKDFLLNPDRKFKDNEGNLVKAADLEGFNITIPHKVKALSILQDVSAQPDSNALLIGSINTVKRDRQTNTILYKNTDYLGFWRSLSQDLKFNPSGKSVLLIGCGGAGRAVIIGLNQEPSVNKIYIYENNPNTVKSLKEHLNKWKPNLKFEFKFISEEDMPKVIHECQLLVNASPVGMEEASPSLIAKNLLHKDLSVYDVIYNRETQLIKDARGLGLSASGGLGMLLYQGVAAWELWTERKADDNIIRAMREALSREI